VGNYNPGLSGTQLGRALSGYVYGVILTRWAEDWVTAYSHGKGELAISDCEDQGIALAVDRLGQIGRVHRNRLLILRTASYFTLQRPGVTAERSLFDGLLVTSAGSWRRSKLATRRGALWFIPCLRI